MKPTEFANKLRRIATAIEHSKSPKRNLVLQDLKHIAATLEEEEEIEEEEEEEKEKCDWCRGEFPRSELGGFGPEGMLCSECRSKAERKYRGKPMAWNAGD